MDAIVKRPVVVEGDAIAVRSMMNLCLSFDHRVLHGVSAARFLQGVRRWLEGFSEQATLYYRDSLSRLRGTAGVGPVRKSLRYLCQMADAAPIKFYGSSKRNAVVPIDTN